MTALNDHELTRASLLPVQIANLDSHDSVRRDRAARIIQRATRQYLLRKSAPKPTRIRQCSSGPVHLYLEAIPENVPHIAKKVDSNVYVTQILYPVDKETQKQMVLELGDVYAWDRVFRVTVSSGSHFERKTNEQIANLCSSRCKSATQVGDRQMREEQAARTIQLAFRQWRAKRS